MQTFKDIRIVKLLAELYCWSKGWLATTKAGRGRRRGRPRGAGVAGAGRFGIIRQESPKSGFGEIRPSLINRQKDK